MGLRPRRAKGRKLAGWTGIKAQV
uniref:Uncharacterized protein n=1 Tax=Arundo donax TaxID=35708 RepID=A0A0A8YW19_ARUDO